MINRFLRKDKKEPKDLQELAEWFKVLERDLKKISSEIENIRKESVFSIQKVGVVRFNPFKEVGGNQSFSIALLNGKNDGVIITSLYSREENRVYGKPIKDGKSFHPLSKEEEKAIEEAKKFRS